MTLDKIVECVPNFSEGKDAAVIQAIAAAAATVPNVSVLDVDAGADFHRTVYTFVGPPEAIVDGALAAAKVGVSLIDMSKHSGEHARMGALDVCPFIPIKGVCKEDCIELSKEFGRRFSDLTGVPCFLYAHSASKPENVRLPDIRKGEYEALLEKFSTDADYVPDFGPKEFIAKSGATATGCRDILIAYNVNLSTSDKSVASKIAGKIRTSGVFKKDENGEKIIGANGKAERIPGRFQGVQGGGMMYNEDIAQVSMNLLNYQDVGMHDVYDAIEEEAAAFDVKVTGSEIVGLVPKESLVLSGRHYAEKLGKNISSEDELVDLAIECLGLFDLSEFKATEKVIEYMIEERLVNQSISEFLDTTASNKPAPGGGSVAALSGALGAALSSMVCNLTLGKDKYQDSEEEMKEVLRHTEVLRAKLTKLIDLDTQAFNDVITAFKMPKDSDEQIVARSSAIQEGYKKAAQVPLTTARTCFEILEHAKKAADLGNPNSISDAAVSALMARSGVHGAILNVEINLSCIKDRGFVKDLSSELADLMNTTDEITEEILCLVRSKL